MFALADVVFLTVPVVAWSGNVYREHGRIRASLESARSDRAGRTSLSAAHRHKWNSRPAAARARPQGESESSDQLIESEVESIVPEALWRRVQTTLVDRRVNRLYPERLDSSTNLVTRGIRLVAAIEPELNLAPVRR